MSKHNNYSWRQADLHLSASDPVMAKLVENYSPCRLASRQEPHFTALCEAIISQQLATKAADAIFARFSNYFDHNPTPAKVAGCPAETLRQLGLSGSKAAYILDLAQNFISGNIQPEQLDDLSDEEITQRLTAVKGIGVWTVQMFLIFSLNRPDVLPVDDLGIKKAIMKQYQLPGLPDKTTMLKIAAPWRPYATIASWYLWRSLEG